MAERKFTGPEKNTRVVVAMSGGVDSSVAAALLVSQGYDVIGIMLRLWSEPDKQGANRCCTPESMQLARRVAAHLGIPFYAIDVRKKFFETVVAGFIHGYAQGTTPNPCLSCNRSIRFGLLLEHARAAGADLLATGHYARVERASDGSYQLWRGKDPLKDQSYVLSVLNQAQLAQALFPVGNFQKSEIRQMADDFQLPVARRADSQDLCFLAGDDYRNFLGRNAPQINRPGKILNAQGEVLGEHAGLANYTIGQRKGLGLATQEPMYVLEKELQSNSLVVGPRQELGRNQLVAGQLNWINPALPVEGKRVGVKIRYQAREVPGKLNILDENSVRVNFDEPLRDITPGQAAVFYDNDLCLGGGIIEG
jgi:tRNA-specific 2-thiouridylase